MIQQKTKREEINTRKTNTQHEHDKITHERDEVTPVLD